MCNNKCVNTALQAVFHYKDKNVCCLNLTVVLFHLEDFNTNVLGE